jgi:hypothetical protein
MHKHISEYSFNNQCGTLTTDVAALEEEEKL